MEVIFLDIKQIERTLTKEFSKSLRDKTIKAIKEYNMIESGDKIAVCISGGKDSMLLAKLLQNYQKYSKIDFSLIFLAMDPGYSAEVREHIEKKEKKLDIPVEFFKTDVLRIVENHSAEHPCFLCAKMRRGYLYSEAKLRSCNKIALGHHYDDAIETVLLSIIYGGQVQAMLPRLRSKNYDDMELIRPLYFVREKDVTAWTKTCELTFMPCGCPVSEKKDDTKRAEIKRLIANLAALNPQIEANILNSVKSVDVEKVIGWRIGKNENHSFLDRF